MGKRIRVRPRVESEILIAVRRRCALCFGLDGDLRRKNGQIAHIDRNALNDAEENLAWLCLPHHSEYDSRSRQQKGILPDELRIYRASLIAHMASDTVQLSATPSPRVKRAPRRAPQHRIGLELYDRRIAIYRACREYLNEIVREADLP
jgi:hypothetical protein